MGAMHAKQPLNGTKSGKLTLKPNTTVQRGQMYKILARNTNIYFYVGRLFGLVLYLCTLAASVLDVVVFIYTKQALLVFR